MGWGGLSEIIQSMMALLEDQQDGGGCPASLPAGRAGHGTAPLGAVRLAHNARDLQGAPGGRAVGLKPAQGVCAVWLSVSAEPRCALPGYPLPLHRATLAEEY